MDGNNFGTGGNTVSFFIGQFAAKTLKNYYDMKQLFYFSLTAILLMTSCAKETMRSNNDLNNPVKFTGNLGQLQTRVGGTDGSLWDAGDSVGVYMIAATPGTLSAVNIVPTGNKRYNASAGATATFTPFDGTPLYYPDDGTPVKFVAYHPYSSGITSAFELPIDLTDQSDQSAIDVLYAPITTTSYDKTTTGAVPLVFDHRLVKLVFTITNAVGVSEPVANGVNILIPSQLREGILDLTDGTVTPSGTVGAVTITTTGTGTTVTAEAIIFPGATTGINFTFTNNAGQIFSAAVPHATAWTGGNMYTYDITLVSASAAIATITGTITPWIDGGNYPINGTEAKVIDVSWYDGGAGPFSIANAAQLAGFASLVNSSTDNFSGKTVTLTADIDLDVFPYNDGAGWTPIGILSHVFWGTFDGDGHEISGVFIDLPTTEYVGLFGILGNGAIKNLGVVNASITGYNYVGGLVGYASDCSIENCYVTGRVRGENGDDGVGGVVGALWYNNTFVENCYTAVEVSSGGGNAGGVAGYVASGSKIQNCYATGEVIGGSATGGIVGTAWNITIEGNLALNPFITRYTGSTGTTFGRVAGNEFQVAATFTDNAAWDNMEGQDDLGNPLSLFGTGAANNKDGLDITAAVAKTKAAYTSRGWLFDDSVTPGPWIWGLDPAYPLPTLYWQTSAPVMPTHL